MGRKGKQTAASSTRSAERLAAGPGGFQFVGFDALAGGDGAVGFITPAAAADDSAITDPQAAVLVSGLSKRDATTKAKALASLQALVGGKAASPDGGGAAAAPTVEAAVAPAPNTTAAELIKHWPRLYRRLCLDPDRRVRARAQHLMGTLGVVVGKRISPHLTGLMGPWLSAQHDTSQDVAAAATAALAAVFPKPERRAKAIAVCFAAVVEHTHDYAVVQTPASVADSQTFKMDANERAELYVRAVATSLLALSHALTVTVKPLPHAPVLAELLGNIKLWKAAGKPQTPPAIRASTFELLSSAIRHSEASLEPAFKKAIGYACAGLADHDLSTARAAWSCVLTAAHSAAHFWEVINPRKTVWPAVWGLLRSGGGVNGRAFVSLPTFLGKVPPEVIGHGHAFHKALFGAVMSGLEHLPPRDADREAMARGVVESCAVLMAKPKVADPEAEDESDDSTESTTDNYIANFTVLLLHNVAIAGILNVKTAVSFLIKLLGRLGNTKETEGGCAALWRAVAALCAGVYQSATVVVALGSGDGVVECLLPSMQAVAEPFSAAVEWVLALMTSLASNAECDSDRALGLVHSLCTAMLPPRPTSDQVAVTSLQRLLAAYSGAPIFATGPIDGAATVKGLLTWLQDGVMTTDAIDAQPDLAQAAAESIMLTLFSALASGHISAGQLADRLESSLQGCATFAASSIFLDACSAHSAALEGVDRRRFGPILDRTCLRAQRVLSEKQGNYGDEADGQVVGAVRVLLAIGALGNALEYVVVDQYRSVVAEISRFCDAILTLSKPFEVHAWLRESMASRIVDLLRNCAVCGGDVMGTCQDVFSAFVRLCLEAGPLCPADELQSTIDTVLATSTGLDEGPQKSNCHKSMIHAIRRALDFFMGGHDPSFLNVAQTPDIVAKCTQSVVATLTASLYMDDVFGSIFPDAELVDSIFLTTVPRQSVLPEDAVAAGIVAGDSDVDGNNAGKRVPTNEELARFCAIATHTARLVAHIDTSRLPARLGPQVYARAAHMVARAAVSVSEMGPAVAGVWLDSLTKETTGTLGGEALRKSLEIPGIANEVIRVAISALNGDNALVDALLLLATVLPESSAGELLEAFTSGQRGGGAHAMFCAQALQTLIVRGGLAKEATEIVIGEFPADESASFKMMTSLLATASTALKVWVDYEDSNQCSIPQVGDDVGVAAPADAASASELRALKALQRAAIANGGNPGDTYMLVESALSAAKSICDSDLAPHVLDDDVKGGLSPEEWRDRLDFSIGLARLFEIGMRYGDVLGTEVWDFVLCTTVAWLELEGDQMSEIAVVAAACRVLTAVSRFFTDKLGQAEAVGAGPKAGAAIFDVRSEWYDFFAPAAGEQLLRQLTGLQKAATSASRRVLLTEVAQSTLIVPVDTITETVDLVEAVAMLETVHSCPTACAVTHVIGSVLRTLEIPEELESVEDFSAASLLLKACSAAIAGNDNTSGQWQMCAAAASLCTLLARLPLQVKAPLVAKVRSEHLTPPVLEFCTTALRHAPTSTLRSLVLGDDELSFFRALSQLDLEHQMGTFAGRVYFYTLRALPVLSRDWFQDLSRQRSVEVASVTAEVFSQKLIQDELSIVTKTKVEDEHLAVTVRRKASEVVGTYSIDDMTMDLVVTFDKVHPLHAVEIGSNRRIGVSAAQWRTWLLQITTYMTNQNGSVLDGFLLWKKNVDKRFEGVEDCMICYAVIHSSNYSLPNLKCRSCRNMFHSACLYKWFSTSQQSLCPLCRNLWVAQH